VAVDFGVEILPSGILRVLVVVSEGDVQAIQHTEELAIISKLVVGLPSVHARTRKDQHTERLAVPANRPIHRAEDGLQLANSILDRSIRRPLDQPERQIRGKVVAGSDNSVYEIAPLSVVILNRGTRDGVEVGHVLGLFRSEGTVALGDRTVPLPEQRYGVMLVFRVFNKLSYAFVMNAKRQVNVNDIFKNP